MIVGPDPVTCGCSVSDIIGCGSADGCGPATGYANLAIGIIVSGITVKPDTMIGVFDRYIIVCIECIGSRRTGRRNTSAKRGAGGLKDPDGTRIGPVQGDFGIPDGVVQRSIRSGSIPDKIPIFKRRTGSRDINSVEGNIIPPGDYNPRIAGSGTAGSGYHRIAAAAALLKYDRICSGTSGCYGRWIFGKGIPGSYVKRNATSADTIYI